MRKAIGGLAGALALAGCASGAPGLRPLTYKEPAETRVLVSYANCPNFSQEGEQVAPIIAAVITGVATKLLDGFGTALTKASEGGALPSSISMSNLELGPKEMPHCLIVVRGKFGAGVAPSGIAGVPNTQAVLDAQQDVTTGPLSVRGSGEANVAAAMPHVTELHHYIELQILSSKDESALTFAPAFTYLAKSMDGSVKGSRELSIAVKFQRPGKAETGGAVLIGDRKLGVPTPYLPAYGRLPFESPWFAGLHTPPTAPETTAAPAPAKGKKGKKAPPKVAPPPKPFPVTLTTTVIETRPTKEFLAFVASVFTDVKPAINTAIKNEVDPATRESLQSGAYDALAKFATSEGKAHSDRITYCALDSSEGKRSERYSKSAAARSAQILANKDALAADVPIPFTTADLIVISGEPVDEANPGRCG